MNVQVYETFERVDRESLQGRTVIVIDVLRATSTIIAGMESGAKNIIPVENIETASRLVSATERGSKLLAGERKGLPVEGFDLFNSPLEFTPDNVGGKTVILTTTNGTRAILSASKAKRVMICALTNVHHVVETLGSEKDLSILCSGNSGSIASEDLFCAGILLKGLEGAIEEGGLSDAGRLSLFLARNYSESAGRFLRTCDRGRELIKLGYEADIDYCADLDRSSIVPEVKQGAVRK